MSDTTPAPKKLPPALKPNDLKAAATERGYYVAIVANDLTYEQVMTPSFWQHHVGVLSGGPTKRPFARVELIREDGTMDLDLRVVSTMVGAVVMRCLRKFVSDENLDKARKAIDPAADERLVLPPGYQWAHTPKGDTPGHLVRLGPTGEILVKGMPSKAAAVAAAIEHFKKVSQPADAG